MSPYVHKNMSAHDYVVIIKDIDKGCATLEQWNKLTANMVFALPWRLLQCCPDGLALAEIEREDTLVEEDDALSNEGNEDEGLQWDEELDWTFKSLVESHTPDPKEAEGIHRDDIETGGFGPEPSTTESVEEEVLAYIAGLHAYQKPYPHVCPSVLTLSPKGVKRRHTRIRIDAFRGLREFTRSQFGNGTSTLRHETDSNPCTDDDLIKLDSFRLANSWHERFDTRMGKYDMTGSKLFEDESGQIVVHGPRSLAEEEY